jgi:hypothetical protein
MSSLADAEEIFFDHHTEKTQMSQGLFINFS